MTILIRLAHPCSINRGICSSRVTCQEFSVDFCSVHRMWLYIYRWSLKTKNYRWTLHATLTRVRLYTHKYYIYIYARGILERGDRDKGRSWRRVPGRDRLDKAAFQSPAVAVYSQYPGRVPYTAGDPAIGGLGQVHCLAGGYISGSMRVASCSCKTHSPQAAPCSMVCVPWYVCVAFGVLL